MSIKEQHTKFQDVLKNLPNKPGVYRYYDQAGQLLYVGKAKNLKNRVRSYFLDAKIFNRRIYLLVNQIYKIEYTIVKTEKEALLLEANLIYHLQPKFNILLKDEQSYLYLKFTYEDEIPGMFIERRKNDPKAKYYGPYQSRLRLREVMRSIRFLLPYCEKKKFDGRPCEYVSLGMCRGVCNQMESREEYIERLKVIERVLQGDVDEVADYFNTRINLAVASQNFELAGFWRDRKQLLERIFTSTFGFQKIVLPYPEDIDIVNLVIEKTPEELYLGSFFVQNIRAGKIVNVNNFLMTGSEVESENNIVMDFLERFMSSFYIYSSDKPKVMLQVFENVS